MKLYQIIVALLLTSPAWAAEKPVVFVPAKEDPVVGDWKSDHLVAQIVPAGEGNYQANIFRAFDSGEKPLAVLKGSTSSLAGDGWSGTIKETRLAISKGDEHADLDHINRTSPTLGAKPPAGAIVLFEGKNLDAWAKKAGKDWLKEDGPAKWKITADSAAEVVPDSDCIITHQKFGDCHLHVEFRTLGAPSNSGVFLQDRYEVNINETYGRLDGTPNGGFDNCTDGVVPKIRASLPPLAWQTFDIDFQSPRFDAAGKKTAPARATVLLNGVKIYDNQSLDVPHGAAARMGEAPTGPLMLQEHGMPVQFRNIWIVEAKPMQ